MFQVDTQSSYIYIAYIYSFFEQTLLDRCLLTCLNCVLPMSQSGISFSPLFLSFSFLFFSPFFTRDRFHQKNTRRVKTVVLPSRSAGRSSTTPRRIRTSIRLENIYIFSPQVLPATNCPESQPPHKTRPKKKKKKKTERETGRERERERGGESESDRQTDRQTADHKINQRSIPVDNPISLLFPDVIYIARVGYFAVFRKA